MKKLNSDTYKEIKITGENSLFGNYTIKKEQIQNHENDEKDEDNFINNQLNKEEFLGLNFFTEEEIGKFEGKDLNLCKRFYKLLQKEVDGYNEYQISIMN